MTAGVQNLDSAAYLPSPPSTSTSDARGTGAAGNPTTDARAADAQGAPSDFQSELELQQDGAQQAGPQRTDSKASSKADPGKPGKKRNVRPEDANPSTVTPVQVAESQKPILPFSLALPQDLAQPQENAQLDSNAKPDEKATPDEIAQGPVLQSAQVLSPSLAAVAQLQKLPQPTVLKPEALPNQTAASNPTLGLAAVTDPGKTPVLPTAPVPSVTQDIPVRQEGQKPEAPASQEAMELTKPGASSNSQTVSPADVKLPATPAEPVASGVQETLDRAPSSPSALAFAARISAAKSDQAGAVNPSQSAARSLDQSAAVSGSQTAVQIPVRYAATAQIIQSAALGAQEDEPKKDAVSIDRSARADARTDMVLPQFETTGQSAASSGSTAPQQAAPPARAESILEPPAAPPTSSHDIRVRVPDNNGGSTQLRFVESGGEVRVSVRTADEGLAQNLRAHLNDLTQRLSDGGMPAEIWKPASNAASSQSDSQQPNQHDGRGSGGQGSGGQSGQQERQQQRPAWLDEMEASLHAEQN